MPVRDAMRVDIVPSLLSVDPSRVLSALPDSPGEAGNSDSAAQEFATLQL